MGSRLKLRKFKSWVAGNLPDSTLRKVILLAPDEVEDTEFLGLVRVWQQLAGLEEVERDDFSLTVARPRSGSGYSKHCGKTCQVPLRGGDKHGR